MKKRAQVIAYQRWIYCDARVYCLSEPVRWGHEDEDEDSGETRYVVVSVNPMECEAVAFACDERGEFVPDDSRRSVGCARSTDPDDAVRALGFEILPPACPPLPPPPPPTKEEIEAFNESLRRSQEEIMRALGDLRTRISPA